MDTETMDVRPAYEVRVAEAGGTWWGYVDVDGQGFWEGGPYASEDEARTRALSRRELFASLTANRESLREQSVPPPRCSQPDDGEQSA